jgi:hypothetical protein
MTPNDTSEFFVELVSQPVHADVIPPGMMPTSITPVRTILS